MLFRLLLNSLCSPGWLKLMASVLPLLPECWGHRCVPSSLALRAVQSCGSDPGLMLISVSHVISSFLGERELKKNIFFARAPEVLTLMGKATSYRVDDASLWPCLPGNSDLLSHCVFPFQPLTAFSFTWAAPPMGGVGYGEVELSRKGTISNRK